MNYAEWLDQLFVLAPHAHVTEENGEIVIYTRAMVQYPPDYEGAESIPVVQLDIVPLEGAGNIFPEQSEEASY